MTIFEKSKLRLPMLNTLYGKFGDGSSTASMIVREVQLQRQKVVSEYLEQGYTVVYEDGESIHFDKIATSLENK